MVELWDAFFTGPWMTQMTYLFICKGCSPSSILRYSEYLAPKSVKYWVGKLPFLIPYPTESQIPTASFKEMSELLDKGCARTLVCDNTIYEMGI